MGRRARRGPLELVAAQEDAEGHQPLNHQQLFNPVIEPQGIAPSKGIAMKNLIVKKNFNNQIRMYLVETNVLAQTVKELTTKYIELLPTQYGIIFFHFISILFHVFSL